MFITIISAALALQQGEPEFKATVDPRVEVLAITMWLSGSYPSPADSTYKLEVWNRFRKFKSHPAVMALKKAKSIYPDFTEVGTQLDGWPKPRVRDTKLTRHWKEILGSNSFDAYFKALPGFIKDSGFEEFFKQNESDYKRMSAEFISAIKRENVGNVLSGFYRYKGGRQAPKFQIYLEPLNGWGAHAILKDEDIAQSKTNLVIQYQLGYLDGDQALDLPVTFKNSRSVASLAWHEGSHVYVAPIFARYRPEIAKLDRLFNREDLASQNISTWEYCLNENVVRAITAVLILQTSGEKAYDRELDVQTKQRKFIYTGIIAELIRNDYFKSSAYANFDEFFPKILERLALIQEE